MTASNVHHADFLSSYYQLPLVKWSLDCYEIQIICRLLPDWRCSCHPCHASTSLMAQSYMVRGNKRSQKWRRQHSGIFTLVHLHLRFHLWENRRATGRSASPFLDCFDNLTSDCHSIKFIAATLQNSILISLTVITLVAFMKVVFFF